METEERPPKRQRISPTVDDGENASVLVENDNGHNPSLVADPKEMEVGIMEFVSPDPLPFQALLKKRYTDFLVNEILPGGEVVHLTDTSVPDAISSNSASKKKQNKKAETKSATLNGHVNIDTPSEIPAAQPDASNNANGSAAVESEEPASILKPGEISENDKQQLISYLNETAASELLELYRAIIVNPTRKPKDHAVVRTDFTNDRSLRAEIHGAIRRIFGSKIDSSTDKEGVLCLTAAYPNTRKPKNAQNSDERSYYPGKLGWIERGGEYLHFTLCKENKDTMEAIGFLVRQLKMNSKSFQFAGTKDRRGVTTQRVSAYHLDADRLVKQNYHLHNAAVGNFEYKPSGLELGDLGGNEFVLTLRECKFQTTPLDSNGQIDLELIQTTLTQALRNLYTHGFLNYYGLQRFGTFSTRTDTIGLHILKNDFRSACEAILEFDKTLLTHDPEPTPSIPTLHTGPGRDEIARAKSIHLFQESGNAHKPLELLPRKFSAENQIMRHLGRSPTDYIGALLAVPRNLRLMYVHAYQSLVWNKAVSHRWSKYGANVVEGDLVLLKEHRDKENGGQPAKPTDEVETGAVDADGEIIIVPPAHDSSTQIDDIFDRARPLTAAEAQSGLYNVFDIVLPLPGYDVLYPANAVGKFYKDFMGSKEGGGLDPMDMRRKHKDFSLSGSYRKILARVGKDVSADVYLYARDEEQFVKTDLEAVRERQRREKRDGESADGKIQEEKVQDGMEGVEQVKDKVAAVLKFQLGASQYATMALRELSRGGVVAYKADQGTAK